LPSANGHLAGPPIQVEILQDQAVNRWCVLQLATTVISRSLRIRENDQAAGFGECAKARASPDTSRK
jgi:hypothetical protein